MLQDTSTDVIDIIGAGHVTSEYSITLLQEVCLQMITNTCIPIMHIINDEMLLISLLYQLVNILLISYFCLLLILAVFIFADPENEI